MEQPIPRVAAARPTAARRAAARLAVAVPALRIPRRPTAVDGPAPRSGEA